MALAVGGLRGVTTELVKMLCAPCPHAFAEGESGDARNEGLGPFSGAAAMGWDLCDALGTFGLSPSLSEAGEGWRICPAQSMKSR